MEDLEIYNLIDEVWEYFPKEFEGYPIMFRKNIITGLIQMQVTDEMAKAMGYPGGLDELREDLRKRLNVMVILPDWTNMGDADVFAKLN